MSDYILGLDLGPNSTGWALVAAEDSEDGLRPTGLLDTKLAGHPPLGVRIFEAGLQNFDTSKEASRNQARRQSRAARRTNARRRARKRDSLAVLQVSGLLPKDSGELGRVWSLCPYETRAAALDRRLEPEELGRALYHLAQRRGFKSNRLTQDDKQEKGMLEEISRLERQILGAGARTLGEYLHMQLADRSGPLPVRLRSRQARMDLYAESPRRARRSMYEDEFETILAAQERLWGRPPLNEQQRAALQRALFFQHPFAVSDERRAKAPARANLHRAPGVRPCPYEPDEAGCPRNEWLAQRFRILKEVQDLRISEQHRPERSLSPEETTFVVDLLSSSKNSSFSSLGRQLARQFKLQQPVEFNLARGGRASIKGNEIEATLASAFGKKAWQGLNEEGRRALRAALVDSISTGALEDTLRAAGLEDEKKLGRLLHFRPRDGGYLSFSKLALEKLMPLMAEGMREHEAIAKVYPDTFQAGGLSALPSLVAMKLDLQVLPKIPPQIQNELTNLTNPVVRRALVEVRKVVNAIIREHGKPARIVVEMAREMKQGKEARRNHSRTLNDRHRLREDAREALKDLRGGEWPSRTDVDRWILWEQQGHVCPYCGKGIGIHEVANFEVEVDHILPRWQSLDDSLNNKALCCGNCNAAKSNRTPSSWLGKDSDRMAAMLKRVRGCVERSDKPGGMPFGKLKRFETESVDADAFVQSQLNDTRYISKLVASYLLVLFPTAEHVGQKRVQTSRGNLTAHLRRMWGLNDVIPPLVQAHGEIVPAFFEHEGWTEKVRVDHRHHAVDALVIALSSRANLKRLQDSWRNADQPRKGSASFEPPWLSLRADVVKAVGAINVSHRPSRRKRGALHAETFYGDVPGSDGVYVTRKRLEELTGRMVGQIRDPRVRQTIASRLRELGWDGKSNKLPRDWHLEEIYLPTTPPRPGRRPRQRHPVRRVRMSVKISRTIRLGDKGHRFAVPGANHCLEVFSAGSMDGLVFQCVSLFDAHQGEQGSQPPGTSLLGTLHRKDSVLVKVDGLPAPVLGVIQSISGSSKASSSMDVMVRDARDSRPASEAKRSPLYRVCSSKKWQALEVRQTQVDPLGRISAGARLFSQRESLSQVGG